MAQTETWIVLTDDWELRGNGRGTVDELQRAPARRLMDLCESLGIRAGFCVEVMQQLAFERHAARDQTIRRGRDTWRRTVDEMLDRGFGVQLHVHPQWHEATLVDDWWKLDRRWHIVDYPDEQIGEMLDAAVGYLRCLAGTHAIQCFRAGSWGLGPPSRTALTELGRRGIKLDISVAPGLMYDGEGIRLDYRQIDSPYLPYVPDIDDVRRVATSPAKAAQIVELPTQTVPKRALVKRLLSPSQWRNGRSAAAEVMRVLHSCGSYRNSNAAAHLGMQLARRLRRQSKRSDDTTPDFVIRDPFGYEADRAATEVMFDISGWLADTTFQCMADICIERIRDLPGPPVRVLVFGCHSKDLQTPAELQRVANVLTYIRNKYPEIEFKLLRDVLANLERIVTPSPWRVAPRRAAWSSERDTAGAAAATIA